MKFNLSKIKTAAAPTVQELENQLREQLAPLAEMFKRGEISQKDIYRLLGTTIKNYEKEIITEELEKYRKPVQDLSRKISKLKESDYDPTTILSEVMSSVNVAVIPQLRRLYILAKKRTAELFKEITITTEPQKETWSTFVSDEKTRILDDTKASFEEFMAKIAGFFGNLNEEEVKVLIRNIPQPANIGDPEKLAKKLSGLDMYFSTNIGVKGYPREYPITNKTGTQIDETFYNQHLSHYPKHGLSELSGTAYPFEPGSMIIFNNKRIHCTSKMNGEKLGISLRFKE
jgi:hypothetical protein